MEETGPFAFSLRWCLHGEVSAYLVGAPAFKAGVAGDPRQAGSIPVHLRYSFPFRGSLPDGFG